MKNLKRRICFGLLILIFLAAGCSGGGSPMSPTLVDLPAPITGRVDISPPDANGNVTVKGTAGAVPANSLVMAVNEGVAAMKNLRILDFFVNTAYAQETSFPAICNEAGHACALSDVNGEFVILLKAAIGDSIAVYIIDAEGNIRSPALRIPVPVIPESGITDTTANCAGRELAGKAADIAIVPSVGIPILLKQGSETTTNQLVIGPAATAVTIDIAGCYAHSLAVIGTPDDITVVVTSKDDKKLFVGHLLNLTIADSSQFSLEDIGEPMHVAFVDSNQDVIIVVKTSSSVELVRLSLTASLTILGRMPPTESGTPVSGLTRSTRLQVVPMDPKVGHYLGLLVTDTGVATSSYLTLFQADGLVHKMTLSNGDMTKNNQPNGPLVNSIVDAAIYKLVPTPPSPTTPITLHVALLDSADPATANNLQKYQIRDLATTSDLSTYSILSLSSDQLEFSVNNDILQNIAVTEILQIAPTALVSASHGTLYMKDLTTGDPLVPVSPPWVSGHDISAIMIDDLSHAFFAVDVTDGIAVDGSSLLTSVLGI